VSTATTVPVSGQGGPVTTTTPGAANLPRTGSNSNFPFVFGAACLVAGGVLALRRRRTWTRP